MEDKVSIVSAAFRTQVALRKRVNQADMMVWPRPGCCCHRCRFGNRSGYGRAIFEGGLQSLWVRYLRRTRLPSPSRQVPLPSVQSDGDFGTEGGC